MLYLFGRKCNLHHFYIYDKNYFQQKFNLFLNDQIYYLKNFREQVTFTTNNGKSNKNAMDINMFSALLFCISIYINYTWLSFLD